MSMKKKRVYVMDCGNFIKIGVSENPVNREKQIPYKVLQYYSSKPVDNPFEIERSMHIYFSKFTALGIGKEYFYTSFAEATRKLMEMVGESCTEKGKTKIDRLKVYAVGGDGHEETEKRIISKIIEAIPQMSEFDKGYILGKTEKIAEESVKRKDENNAKRL